MPAPRHAATVLAVAALALTACGKQTLNTDKAEQVIADGIESQTGARNVTVECPADIELKPGDRFTCTARAQGKQAPVQVTQKDDQGNISWEIKQSGG